MSISPAYGFMQALRFRARARMHRTSPWNTAELLREELLGAEQLEKRAVEIAAEQVSSSRRDRLPSLGERLDDNEAALRTACNVIGKAVRDRRDITPAAEWLFDNFYLIEAQVDDVREDLPPGYYRQLPRLADGHLAGYPRVLGIAWEFVAHTDSHVEPESLRRFVQAYQRVQVLTIGEQWAVSISLRIVLIENLRRAADRIISSRNARQHADDVVDRLLGMKGHEADADALKDALEGDSQLPSSFLVQVLQRLRDQDPQVTPALLWLEGRLAALGESAEAIIHAEHQRQAGSNVTVRNIITSMRRVSEVDWAEFFESVSLVDEVLRANGGFGQMDFATRNLYRTAIEDLSRGSGATEVAIAGAACAAASGGVTSRERDPGYHLIAGGRSAFEKAVGYRVALRRVPGRWFRNHGAAPYVLSIVVLALGAVVLAAIGLGKIGAGVWQVAVLAMLVVPLALDGAVALVNRIAMRGCGATILPGLELADGIAAPLRTLVAVPAMLVDVEAIGEQIDRLEVHHLSSPDGDLTYALVTDWVDAGTRELASDAGLLEAATAGIAKLNSVHEAGPAGPRFLLLHRRRCWCPTQQLWMGWERKRGKLHELNRLLRGATDTSFIAARQVPTGVRFVVTLDADTRVPRDAVRRLVGKMAHPLNHPRFDPLAGRVVEGYAVLQPRVTASLPAAAEGSAYLRVTSVAAGIDPYAAAASDVYQDLFGEGSYAGKGIYDIDAFEAALADRTADGTLLSHDLFEGLFARAGLVSDIEVVEEYPSRYDLAMTRAHRWARGDWQLLPWLLGRRRVSKERARGRRVSLLGYWKMIDNLRRTLTAPASYAALVFAWSQPFAVAWWWTAFILLMIGLPTLLPVMAALLPRRADTTASSHLRALVAEIWLSVRVCMMRLVFLADQAWLMADAIARTLYRLCISQRHLLDWIPAAQASVRRRPRLAAAHLGMAGGLSLTVLGALATYVGPDARNWWLAVPMLVMWVAAPVLATSISRRWPRAGRLRPLVTDTASLRVIARRTWRYFESFVTASDNWLPPDNFQFMPRDALASRTSPTNIGLYLLSTVSARDLGWIDAEGVVERIESTLRTMERLQRYRGHFLNWYDTRDLRALEPLYVSTVDSGNLAAHLVTVAQALREWSSRSSPGNAAAGCMDSLTLTRLASAALPQGVREHSTLLHLFEAALRDLTDLLATLQSRPDVTPEAVFQAATQSAGLADIARTLAVEGPDNACDDLVYWSEAVHRSAECWHREASRTSADHAKLQQRMIATAAVASTMANAMEFGFLLDPQRKLFSIGYRVADDARDAGCYDLLASEARLASFFAIAKADVSARHWFRLGRPFAPAGHGAVLLSWSGSMFEYLMPSLVMRVPEDSLLGHSERLAVAQQQRHGLARNLPWGVSESAYDARDLDLTYQYSNFGVPGLGLRRGLDEAAVVAPYATALAAMINPAAAMRNFARLDALGATGRYGFVEALDFTRSRLREDVPYAVVGAFMAHHQGMSIVAIANVVLHGLMRERFHALPQVRATELLLQERAPRTVSAVRLRTDEPAAGDPPEAEIPASVRRLQPLKEGSPQVQLLSNERYSVMVSAAGSGYSHWKDLAISRWREDSTCDESGSYVYLRDLESGRLWSPGCQPCRNDDDHYETLFSQNRAQFLHRAARITTMLEIVVSPEEDSEARLLTISNRSSQARDIEITSCVDAVLDTPAADLAHQAFSKLFVQTQFDGRLGALIATRRRRSPAETPVWAAHQLFADEYALGKTEYETERVRFLGRGHDKSTPQALMGSRQLSGTTGTVLDPVLVLRQRLRIPAGGSARCVLWTTAASSREHLLDILGRHLDASSFGRASTLAWTHAQIQLRHLAVTAAEANVFQQLAGHLLLANGMFRPTSAVIERGSGTASELWRLGISGDLPILLLRIDATEDIAVARQLLQAHEYWRMKQLAVDLVILNERPASYLQDLQAALEILVRTRPTQSQPDAGRSRGSVHVLRINMLPASVGALLSSVARVVLLARHGSLVDQLERRRLSSLVQVSRPRIAPRTAEGPPAVPAALEFFNGLGGFAADGREYVTVLNPGQQTPAPWINVIANSQFGFQVGVEGSGYTWAQNSRENQLTPWSNDPVSDRTGECLYVQDEEDGDLWSATLAPQQDRGSTYTAAHGQGYSRFTHESRGIALQLLTYVPLADPIRISRLILHNTSGRTRSLLVTAYMEWVLGPARAAMAPYVITRMDSHTGAMFVRNPWSATFGSRTTFMDMAGAQTAWTADRREFLGRYGSVASPLALTSQAPLSGRVGAGLDPCGVLQQRVTLEPGQSREVVLFVGQVADDGEARALLARFRSADLDAALGEVTRFWDQALGTVQVRTPDRALDLLLNRWALYQTLSCRYWARAAFYQASGAYGFRDQLQDGMAMAISQPALTREHLLRAAGRQFAEGDVQHWWLPVTGTGVRTRISDDRIWLAYATAHYVRTTGDLAVLDEQVPFLEGLALDPDAHDAFFQPGTSEEVATLYEHCARGLDHALAVGQHGLPLIGTGDWNDGMNRVGEQGRGESVWLGWFLHATLSQFAPISEQRGTDIRARRWRAHAGSLQAALEANGWDGQWYRRGFFDDGTALGSAVNAECRIDSIAQSWGVLSGAADPVRSRQAMSEVDAQLIRRADSLALLFTPPFSESTPDPGYIQGYPPGLRENGGQYTHAAAWSVMAFAALGQGEKAAELFSMLNPVNRATSRSAAHRYKVEPYVVAADIYSVAPHVGRGGWTWYTGSAGWLYRAGLESILGFRLQGTRLTIAPCIPKTWPRFEMAFRYRTSVYEIQVDNADQAGRGPARMALDGQWLAAGIDTIDLLDDGAVHSLHVVLQAVAET